MRRVTGLPDDQVTAWEAKLEQQVVDSLQSVMDRIAARIERIQVASVLVAVATTGPTGDDDPPPMTGELAIPEPVPLPEVLPPDAGLPPGQPYISPDDLASIAPMWQQAVADQILPLAAQVFIDSAGHLRSQFLDSVSPGVLLSMPGLGSVAAEEYLARARNTFDEIGDHLWTTARAQLSQGFEAGESIPQLGARLRQSAGLSARTAVMVARTQVIEASNAGSIAMARASRLEMEKEWIATPDLRTRPTHLHADGQRVALSAKFLVGGFLADFPADPSLPYSERLGCRCTQGYVMPERQPALPGQDLAQLPGTSAPAAEIEAPEPALDEVLAKEPGEAGFDLDDFPEPPPIKVRSALLRARTDRELIAAWQGEMRAVTGRDIIVQLPPDSSVLTMREHAEGVLQMLERFPEARLRKISWYDTASTEYAHVRAGSGTLEFNAKWASTAQRREYLASLRHDVSGWDDAAGPGYGWSVRGAKNPQATAWHEMAHILSIETLGGKLKAEAMQITLRRMAADGLSDMGDFVSRQISAYAASKKGNFEEMIAEAMTDVMANGPRASLLSRELYDMVAREYRAKGFAVRTTGLPDAGDVFEDFTRETGEAFPKAADAGWVPGRWEASPVEQVRRQIAEHEYQVYVANQRQFGLEVDERYGRDLGAGIARQELPDGARAVQNGDYLIVDPRHGISDDVRAAVQRQFDALTEVEPLRGPFMVRFGSSTGDSHSGPDDISLTSKLSMERTQKPGARFFMPSANDQPKAVYTLTHEYGHSVMYQRGHGPDAMRLFDELNLKHLSDEGLIVPSRTLGYYGAEDYKEAYAEAFAEWMLSAGLTENPMVLRYAGEFGWRNPLDFDEVFPKAAGPRALASQTVAQLRALAKERGITVPAGTRKVDLVRMLDEGVPPADVAPMTLDLSVKTSLSAAEQARVRALVRRDPQIYATVQDRYGRVSDSGNLSEPDMAWLQEIYERDRPFVERIAQEAQIKRALDAEAKKLGVAPAEYRAREVAKLKEVLDGKPVAVRVRDEAGLQDILSGGRFKTSLEGAKRGPGLTAAKDRRMLGETVMGVPPESPIAERPIYGYVGIRGIEPALSPGRKIAGIAQREGQEDILSVYGQVTVVLRPGVRARTTVTVGDSLDELGFVRPSPIDAPSADSLGIRGMAAIDRPEFTRTGYVEAQVRGGLRREDIDEVFFADEPAAATVAALRDAGIPWRVLRRTDEPVFPTPAVLPVPVVPSAALPARVVAGRAELERVRALPVLEDKSRRMGGQSAYTTQVEHVGGPPTIVKDYSRADTKVQGVRNADAEELGSLVDDAIELRPAAVVRTGPRSIEQEFLTGQNGADILPFPHIITDDWTDSDNGRLMGLADLLMGDGDRNAENLIRRLDGHLSPIDRGGAFRTQKLAGADGPFGGALIGRPRRVVLGLERIGDTKWSKSIDMAPADLVLIRTRLEALRPEFERLKRGTWWNQMMARLAEVEKRATGTRTRLAEAAESVVSPEVRAVARQAIIDERRAVADSLGEVRELLANGASERALASRARLIAGRADGQAKADLDALVKAMESGDADRIRVALGDVAQRRGLTEVGGGGSDVVAFDPKVHEVVGGARRPPVGTFVQVQRPGYSVRLDDGEVVQLSKAKVDTLTPDEIVERTAAQERKALREAARERNRVVEAQRATAKLLAEVDELAAKGATKTAIRERLDPALRGAGQAYAGADAAGADAAVVDTISAALDSGDMAKIRAAVTRASTKAKIKPIGRAGAKTTFDPDTMEGVGGIDIAPGAKVTVVRRGSTLPGVETPEKAQVTPVVAPVKAAAPKSRAPRKAKSSNADIERRARTGVVEGSEVDPGQGVSAVTRRVQFEDGTFGYRKTVHESEFVTTLDDEYLDTLVMQAVGAPVPGVYRASSTTLYLQEVKGKIGRDLTEVEGEAALASPEGRLIGLGDALMGNADRHIFSANVVGTPEGRIVAIDNAPNLVIREGGERWEFQEPRDSRGVPLPQQDVEGNDFIERWVDRGPEGSGVRSQTGAERLDEDLRSYDEALVDVWRENDLTRAEYLAIRAHLEALRSEFEALNRADQLSYIIGRLDAIAEASSVAATRRAAIVNLGAGPITRRATTASARPERIAFDGCWRCGADQVTYHQVHECP